MSQSPVQTHWKLSWEHVRPEYVALIQPACREKGMVRCVSDDSAVSSALPVLQLRLQQRRTREQLVDQGIMPPLKTPAVFHEQIRSLERSRTENFLKHKIRSRPDRAELVRMHILQETQAEPSLQAAQMKLKRARLADDLNEKIAQRPGPLELVQKNILPVDSSVKEAIIEEANSRKTLDVYNFDEDSSEALSPENPDSQESQCSIPSPREAKLPEISASPSPGANSQVMLTNSLPSRSPNQGYQKQEPSEAHMDSAYAPPCCSSSSHFLHLQILSQQQHSYQAILPSPCRCHISESLFFQLWYTYE
uniref:Phosphatase and actin regulator n=1 Tax=Electrophorus electricus TaxID=8005 RepID=A0AAY5EXK5_ELEEL